MSFYGHWNAMSPDLDPIEHVWCQLMRAISKEKYTIGKRSKLMAAIAAFWQNFPQELVQKPHQVHAQKMRGCQSC